MSIRNAECLARLQSIGISWDDACALRRISMTLHRWHELECGDSDAYSSWCVVRGRKMGQVRANDITFEYDDASAPYLERHYNDPTNVTLGTRATYHRIPDRERGAQKRLAKIMARYPTLTAYVQGDPRGAALYILRPGDVPEGASVDSCYSNGVAVYQ